MTVTLSDEIYGDLLISVFIHHCCTPPTVGIVRLSYPPATPRCCCSNTSLRPLSIKRRLPSPWTIVHEDTPPAVVKRMSKRRNDDGESASTSKRRAIVYQLSRKGKIDRVPMAVPVNFLPSPMPEPTNSPATPSQAIPTYGYTIVPNEKRFLVLRSFLRRKKKEKGIVFFSSSGSTTFHRKLLSCFQLSCVDIHERKKRQRRESTLADFSKARTGVLLCSNSAARGLVVPGVDWMVQYDPPRGAMDFIEKVVQLAQHGGFKGRALLFLNQNELPFIRHFQAAKVNMKPLIFLRRRSKLENLQKLMEKLAVSHRFNKDATVAYRSYISSYASHPIKDIFNLEHLDLQAVANSFCLLNPPLTLKDMQQEGQWDDISSKLEDLSLDSLQINDGDDILNVKDLSLDYLQINDADDILNSTNN